MLYLFSGNFGWNDSGPNSYWRCCS